MTSWSSNLALVNYVPKNSNIELGISLFSTHCISGSKELFGHELKQEVMNHCCKGWSMTGLFWSFMVLSADLLGKLDSVFLFMHNWGHLNIKRYELLFLSSFDLVQACLNSWVQNRGGCVSIYICVTAYVCMCVCMCLPKVMCIWSDDLLKKWGQVLCLVYPYSIRVRTYINGKHQVNIEFN